MKRLILALILLVVVLITGCADAGRRDQDKKSVHGPAVTLRIRPVLTVSCAAVRIFYWRRLI